jgi:hypothetical protein
MYPLYLFIFNEANSLTAIVQTNGYLGSLNGRKFFRRWGQSHAQKSQSKSETVITSSLRIASHFSSRPPRPETLELGNFNMEGLSTDPNLNTFSSETYIDAKVGVLCLSFLVASWLFLYSGSTRSRFYQRPSHLIIMIWVVYLEGPFKHTRITPIMIIIWTWFTWIVTSRLNSHVYFLCDEQTH